jgi:hypothetical protein
MNRSASFAGLDRSELVAESHRARAVDRRHLEDGRRRNAGKDERLHFTVRSKTGQELAPARVVGADRDQPPPPAS